MAIDALLAWLGPARVSRWACDGDAAFCAARTRELAELESIETELRARTGRSVVLGPPLVPFREVTAPDAEPLERLALRVGDDEGLAPLQELARGLAPESTPHLVGHDPRAGIFVPVDFPEPVTVGRERLSVGSLTRLRDETRLLLERLRDADAVVAQSEAAVHLANLDLMAKVADEYGVGLELA